MDDLERIYRQNYSNIISRLSHKFGFHNIDIIEDAAHDAMIEATKAYSDSKMMNNPGGWLYIVAKNKVLDKIRKKSKEDQYDILENDVQSEESLSDSGEFDDEILELMFALTNPVLDLQSQIALILNILMGFKAFEIAKAFVLPVKTIEKRIERSKLKLRDEKSIPEFKGYQQVADNLDTVLRCLYLIFNEGYDATKSDKIIREEFSYEAIRLTEILYKNQKTKNKSLTALLSLFYFQSSRLQSRMDEEGNLLLLEDQDRNLWNSGMIKRAKTLLIEASRGDIVSEYHLRAGIASLYTENDINWHKIKHLYQILVSLTGNPLDIVNYSVSVYKADGGKKALSVLKQVEKNPNIEKYYLFFSLKGEYYLNLKNYLKALENFEKARGLTSSPVIKKFLGNKIENLKNI